MTTAELAGRLDAINKRLAIARNGRNWGDVAELQAERQAVVDELDAAMQAEAQAVQDAQRNAAAQHRVDLAAQGAALEGRWLLWLTALDGCEREARALWAEHDAIRQAETQLQAAYGKATGETLALTTGSLTGAALAVKRGAGALKWAPRTGALDE